MEIYWGGKGQIKCPSSFLLSASLLTVLLHAPLKAILSFSSFLWGMFHFPLFMYLRLSSFIQDVLKDEKSTDFCMWGWQRLYWIWERKIMVYRLCLVQSSQTYEIQKKKMDRLLQIRFNMCCTWCLHDARILFFFLSSDQHNLLSLSKDILGKSITQQGLTKYCRDMTTVYLDLPSEAVNSIIQVDKQIYKRISKYNPGKN